MSFLKKKPPEVQDVENNIKKWLSEEGYNVRNTKFSEMAFSFIVSPPRSKGNYLVLQKKDEKDCIRIVRIISLAKNGRNLIKRLNDKKRKEFLTRIQIDLLKIGCEFIFYPRLTDAPIPNEVHLSKKIYYDGLSKDNFFNTLDLVLRGAGIILLNFLGEAELSMQEAKKKKY